MAILDDIRSFLGGGKPVSPIAKPTTPTPTFGQSLMQKVQPVQQAIQQNPLGRMASSAGKEAFGFLGDVGQGVVGAITSPAIKMLGAAEAQKRASTSLLLQQQAKELQQKLDFTKARGLMDAADRERNIGLSFEPSLRNKYNQDAVQSATGGVKSLLSASGLKAGVPSIISTGVIGAGLGAGLATLTGDDPFAAAGQGLGSAPRLAGLNRLTTPVVDKVLGRFSGVGSLPVRAVGSGLFNVAEDNLYTAGTEGRLPTANENILSAGIGAVSPIAGSAINLSSEKYNQLKNALIEHFQLQNPKQPIAQIVKKSEDVLQKMWKETSDGKLKRDNRYGGPIRTARDIVRNNKQSAYGLAAGFEQYQDENGEWKVRYNSTKGLLGVGLMAGYTQTPQLKKLLKENLISAKSPQEAAQIVSEMTDSFLDGADKKTLQALRASLNDQLSMGEKTLKGKQRAFAENMNNPELRPFADAIQENIAKIDAKLSGKVDIQPQNSRPSVGPQKTTPPTEPLAPQSQDLKAQIAGARSSLLENTQSPKTPQIEMPVLKPNQSVPDVVEKPTLVGNKPPQESMQSTKTPQSPLKQEVSQNPLEEIISRPQVPASDINVRRLNLDTEQQARVTDSQVKELRDVLTNKEIERIAQGAGIDTKTHTPDQVAKKIAEQLNARRQVTESEVQRTKMLESGVPLEELIKKTREIADRSRISREQGTEIAQQLAARRIIANEISTPMQRIFQLLDQAGINPDVYVKDAATLDFNDGNAVVNFYRKYVPAGRREWIDLVRYNSMLSSPNTFINNAFSNLQGSAIIAPIEKTITGGVDLIKSALTGSKREYFVGEGWAYAKGYFKAFDDAKKNFTSVLRGKKLITNPDYKNIPLTQSGTLKRKIEDKLMGPMKLLEATDQFFTTMVKGGVKESLDYRSSKGGRTGDVDIVAEAEAAKRLFRSKLGDNNGSLALDAIDVFANTVQKLKSSKNPAASFIARFTLPFVQTPTNILKQGVEYSPAGILTLKGSSKKTEQLSKAIMGTSIAAGVAMLAGSDRLTWAEPTSEKQKAAFRAAGMQPYSVKIGDEWVSYSKLHPAIAFNFALVAALKNAEDNKDLDQTQVETILKASSNWLNFFADQSYVKSIGDTVAGFKGDIEAKTRIGGNYLQQAIPFRALSGWVARIVDPYQRKVDTDGSILQQQFDYLKTQIPFVSQTVPARLGPTGDPIKNQNKEFNAISPVRVTTENPAAKEDFKFLQEQSKLDKEKRQLKEKFMKEAEKATTVEKVGAAESADVAGKGLPSTTTSEGKKLEGPGSYKTPQVVQTESLSKFQKDKVKTYLEYGKAIPEKDLINYYLGDIDKPANSSNYEKTIHQRELLKMYDKVSEDESLSKEQKSSVQKSILSQSGLTSEQVEYNKVANQDNDLKYQYLSDQIAGKNHEQVLEVLARGRKESVTGDVLTSDDVLKNLYDEGIIDSTEFGQLKKIKYTNSGALKESKGSGKKKITGVRFDFNLKSRTTKPFKFKRPTVRTGAVNLLPKSNLKALTFKGKPLKFKK